MTKSDIAQYLYDKFGDLTTVQASTYVEVLIDTIKNTLADGEDVMLSGFGKFSVRDKKARVGRNPVTGDKLLLEARRVVTFKPSTMLKEQVNRGSNKQ
jgi:integration host factor subunit alpha